MPLEFLAVMVVVGLALVIGAVQLSGLSRNARIERPEDAISMFLADFPEEAPVDIMVTMDGRDAFLALDGGRVGMVHAIGARFLTRLLSRGALAFVACVDNTVEMRLNDFTLPRERAAFGQTSEAARLAGWLEGLVHA